LRIPEKYGIFHTVGDSIGPGGWSRSIRNIPVFRQLALDIQKIAPRAVVLNYSNPLASLTAALTQSAPVRSVGLCHGLFEVYALLEHVFNLKSEKELSLRAAGVNHFFWVLDFTIRGEPGYPLLRERLKKNSFPQLVGASYAYNIYQDKRKGNGKVSPRNSHASEYFVVDELLREYGLLPYTGDRHTSEFMSRYLTLSPRRLKPYRLKRTTIAERRKSREEARKRVEAMVAGELPLPTERSREAAADIMAAMITNKDFTDVVNLPNVGQVDNLPRGAVVETLGVANAMGFTPLAAGSLPEPILCLVRPHAVNQRMIVEAALTGNRELALAALRNEPMCAHLSYPRVRKMGLELLHASEKQGMELPL
jgi:alpha-galactosidase/6-phospho-beta-glucosidase family protein